MTDAAKGLTDFDPIADVRKEVESFTADPLGDMAKAASASPEAACAARRRRRRLTLPSRSPRRRARRSRHHGRGGSAPARDATEHEAKAGSGA